MGKTIISQARGHGSFTYRVRRKAYKYKVGYPSLGTVGKAKVISLINSPAHSAPLAKIAIGEKTFYIPACQNLFEGQEIEIGSSKIADGNIICLRDATPNTKVFNIEIRPGDGGKIGRTSGNFATVLKAEKGRITILLPNKKEITLDENCRATIGIIAGHGRILKPIVKAGKKWHMAKAKNRLWPRTSAVKVNAVDHPFGCGRGKRIKSKIAKRNAPAGAKVGHLKPRQTGVKK